MLIDKLNDLKSKVKPIRGQRRLMHLYEDSCGEFELPTYMGNIKEKNISLNQKERNVVRIQMESVLNKFQQNVDDNLRKNKLKQARVDQNVVDVVDNILNKLQVADYKDGVETPPFMGILKKNDDIMSIDFKSLLEHEEDKKKIIYGLFDSILETNLEGIRDVVGSKYKVEIQYKKSKANVLSITEYDSGRCCYIKYENVNPESYFGCTKEEIEEYLQRIVIGFVMEYDK